jgi:hypothetical protein
MEVLTGVLTLAYRKKSRYFQLFSAWKSEMHRLEAAKPLPLTRLSAR